MVQKNRVLGGSFSVLCMLCGALVMGLYYQFRSEENEEFLDSFTKDVNFSSKVKCDVLGYLGDGFCDDEANNEVCQFDKGDCCDTQNDRSLCADCYCYTPKNEALDCIEYLMSCHIETQILGKIGDGICHDDLNTLDCYFDGGDCCLDSGKSECQECVCISSNVTCVEAELGDGICQDHNNFNQCDYDLGDCCENRHLIDDWDQCCDCKCKHLLHFVPAIPYIG